MGMTSNDRIRVQDISTSCDGSGDGHTSKLACAFNTDGSRRSCVASKLDGALQDVAGNSLGSTSVTESQIWEHLTISLGGHYKVCFCANLGPGCNTDESFPYAAGDFYVQGKPDSVSITDINGHGLSQGINVTGYDPRNHEYFENNFTIRIHGTGMTAADRIRVVGEAQNCGQDGAQLFNDQLDGHLMQASDAPGSRRRTAHMTELSHSTQQSWDDLQAKRGGLYRVCYCPNFGDACDSYEEFATEAGTFYVKGMPLAVEDPLHGTSPSTIAVTMTTPATSTVPEPTVFEDFSLQILGVGLNTNDRIRLVETDLSGGGIRCGGFCSVFSTTKLVGPLQKNPNTASVYGSTNNAETSQSYTGLQLTSGGRYRVCWCPNQGNACDDDAEFYTEVGTFFANGAPQSLSEFACDDPTLRLGCRGTFLEPEVGFAFTLQVTGLGLNTGDRITVVEGGSSGIACGQAGAKTSIASALSGPLVDYPHGCQGDTSTTGTCNEKGSTENKGTSQIWSDLTFSKSGRYRVCYCANLGTQCTDDAHFATEVATGFTVRGSPQRIEDFTVCGNGGGSSCGDLLPSADDEFILQVRGFSLASGDRIRVVAGVGKTNEVQCGGPGAATNTLLLQGALAQEPFTAGVAGSTLNLETSQKWSGLRLSQAGGYRVCWCANAGSSCTSDAQFRAIEGVSAIGTKTETGVFEVVGQPSAVQSNNGAALQPVAGEAFALQVAGTGLTTNDRIRIVLSTVTCGREAAASHVDSSYFQCATPSASCLATADLAGTSGSTGDSTTSQVWVNLKIQLGGVYKVCWCPNKAAQCDTDSEFQKPVGTFTVRGAPNAIKEEKGLGTLPLEPFATNAFNLQLEGIGLTTGDRIRVVASATVCGETGASTNVPQLSGTLGNTAGLAGTTGSVSTSLRWSRLSISHGGSYRVCWCPNDGKDCNTDARFVPLSSTDSLLGAFIVKPLLTQIADGLGSNLEPVTGDIFALEVLGKGMQVSDRIRVVAEWPDEVSCGTNGAAVHSSALGCYGYQETTLGAKTCSSGYRPITTRSDCRSAFSFLGLSGTSIDDIDFVFDWSSSRPQGCFRNSVTNRVRFNPGIGYSSDASWIGDDFQICTKECLFNDPTTVPAPGSTVQLQSSMKWEELKAARGGYYRICYCSATHCATGADFNSTVPNGVSASATPPPWFAIRGKPTSVRTLNGTGFGFSALEIEGVYVTPVTTFALELVGLGLTRQDRIRIVNSTVLCGSVGASTKMTDISAKLDASTEMENVGPDTHQLWTELRISHGGLYRVCWCPNHRPDINECVKDDDFATEVPGLGLSSGSFQAFGVPLGFGAAGGRHVPLLSGTAGEIFMLQILGIGFTMNDRIRAVCAAEFGETSTCGVFTSCGGTGAQRNTPELGGSLSKNPNTPGEAGSTRSIASSQTWDILFWSAGTYAICWCGNADIGGCDTDSEFSTRVGGVNAAIHIRGPTLFEDPRTPGRLSPTSGQSFTVAVLGKGLSLSDRIRVVEAVVHCGNVDATMNTPLLSGPLATSEGPSDLSMFSLVGYGWCVDDVGAYVVGVQQLSSTTQECEASCATKPKCIGFGIQESGEARCRLYGDPDVLAGDGWTRMDDRPSGTTYLGTTIASVSNDASVECRKKVSRLRWDEVGFLGKGGTYRICWDGSNISDVGNQSTNLTFSVDAGNFTCAGPQGLSIAGKDVPIGLIGIPFTLVLSVSSGTAEQKISIVKGRKCGQINTHQNDVGISTLGTITQQGTEWSWPSVEATATGLYSICWCGGGDADCSSASDFRTTAGTLRMVAVPSAITTSLDPVVAGLSFDIDVIGQQLSTGDRIRVVSNEGPRCGEQGSQENDISLSCIIGTSCVVDGGPPTNVGTSGSTVTRFASNKNAKGGIFRVCWCGAQGAGCDTAAEFVDIGSSGVSFTVEGPTAVQTTGTDDAGVTLNKVLAGNAFSLTVLGRELKSTNKVRILSIAENCGSYNVTDVAQIGPYTIQDTTGTLASDRSSLSWSASDATPPTISVPGIYRVCWRGDDEYPDTQEVEAGRMLVNGNANGVKDESGTDLSTKAGENFTLEVHGSSLTSNDRIRIVAYDVDCSTGGNQNTPYLEGPLAANPGIEPEAGISGIESALRFNDLKIFLGGSFRVCHCANRGDSCGSETADFDTPKSLTFLVAGPTGVEGSVFYAGTRFSLKLLGVNMDGAISHIRIVSDSIQCGTPGASGLVSALQPRTLGKADDADSGGSWLKWQGLTLLEGGGQQYRICWCSSSCENDIAYSDYNVDVGKIVVAGPTTGGSVQTLDPDFLNTRVPTSGVPMAVMIVGTRLQDSNRIRVVRADGGRPVSCGQDGAGASDSTLSGLLGVGAQVVPHDTATHRGWTNLVLYAGGAFRVCWCAGLAPSNRRLRISESRILSPDYCTEDVHFAVDAGIFVTKGPYALEDQTNNLAPSTFVADDQTPLSPKAGMRFTLQIRGVGLATNDRIRVVQGSVRCGDSGSEQWSAGGLLRCCAAAGAASEGNCEDSATVDCLASNPNLVGIPGSSQDSSTTQMWTKLGLYKGGLYRVCWCPDGGLSCDTGPEFNVEVATFTVRGPIELREASAHADGLGEHATLAPVAGNLFKLGIYGSGLDIVDERVRVVLNQQACGQSGANRSVQELAGPWTRTDSGVPENAAEIRCVANERCIADPAHWSVRNTSANDTIAYDFAAWGNLSLSSALDGGRYRVCWCPGGCKRDGDFMVSVGDFDVLGIYKLHQNQTRTGSLGSMATAFLTVYTNMLEGGTIGCAVRETCALVTACPLSCAECSGERVTPGAVLQGGDLSGVYKGSRVALYKTTASGVIHFELPLRGFTSPSQTLYAWCFVNQMQVVFPHDVLNGRGQEVAMPNLRPTTQCAPRRIWEGSYFKVAISNSGEALGGRKVALAREDENCNTLDNAANATMVYSSHRANALVEGSSLTATYFRMQDEASIHHDDIVRVAWNDSAKVLRVIASTRPDVVVGRIVTRVTVGPMVSYGESMLRPFGSMPQLPESHVLLKIETGEHRQTVLCYWEFPFSYPVRITLHTSPAFPCLPLQVGSSQVTPKARIWKKCKTEYLKANKSLEICMRAEKPCPGGSKHGTLLPNARVKDTGIREGTVPYTFAQVYLPAQNTPTSEYSPTGLIVADALGWLELTDDLGHAQLLAERADGVAETCRFFGGVLANTYDAVTRWENSSILNAGHDFKIEVGSVVSDIFGAYNLPEKGRFYLNPVNRSRENVSCPSVDCLPCSHNGGERIMSMDEVHIKNFFGTGTFLNANGEGCQNNVFCVSATTLTSYEDSSMLWRIQRRLGPGQIQHEDEVYLVSLQSPESFLDVRGGGCQSNLHCVSTATSNMRDGNSGLWKIYRKLGTGNLHYGDEIYVESLYNGAGGFLDVRGAGCSYGTYCVSTAVTSTRDGNSGSWSVLFDNACTMVTRRVGGAAFTFPFCWHIS